MTSLWGSFLFTFYERGRTLVTWYSESKCLATADPHDPPEWTALDEFRRRRIRRKKGKISFVSFPFSFFFLSFGRRINALFKPADYFIFFPFWFLFYLFHFYSSSAKEKKRGQTTLSSSTSSFFSSLSLSHFVCLFNGDFLWATSCSSESHKTQMDDLTYTLIVTTLSWLKFKLQINSWISIKADW
jgi:hypothetical protein